MENFLSQHKITVLLAPTTGVVGTVSTGAVLDMAGYDSVVFFTGNSTVTTTGAYLAVYQSCSSGAACVAPIAGSAVAFGSCEANKGNYSAVEIYRPEKRFLAPYLVSASSCGNIGIYAIQSKGSVYNVTQSTSCFTEFIASATSGTA